MTTADIIAAAVPAVRDDADLAPRCDKENPKCDQPATWYITARCPIDGCEQVVWLACDHHYAGMDKQRKYRCAATGRVFVVAKAITGTGRIGGAS